MKPRLLIFASGSKTGGGSGFANLVKASRKGILDAEIVGVVSNHDWGGVKGWAEHFSIPFTYFEGPYPGGDAEWYQNEASKADFVALSGWLKLVSGLDPRKTFNIHPGPLPQFGGKGMHGRHVHEAVIEAYHRGEITHSAVSMHFVTEKYDEGPVFMSIPVEILPDDTADTLGMRVNRVEHQFQPIFTDHVMHGRIRWDGKNPDSLVIES